MKFNPLTAIDFYKTDHRNQYPSGTTEIYSNLTARSSKHANVIQKNFDNKIVFFGLQYFIKDFLQEIWQNEFFQKPKSEVIKKYQERMDFALGPGAIECSHLEKLHDLGYLPLRIKAFDEGARVPIGVPLLTIVNTKPEFFWLTNYVETILLTYLWKPITSATTAFELKKLLLAYAKKTGSNVDFVKFQAHDFSFRGMSSYQDAMSSGAAHLTSFVGTDTVPAIDFAEEFYGANPKEELIGASVPATEHSVMCMGTEEGEFETFNRLLTEIYPTGILSVVSDSWDYWRVLTDYLPKLKETILNRDGKLVIRPDSGDPIEIIAGNPNAPENSPEHQGSLRILWEIFGGTKTSTGHKLINGKIGIIYGDAVGLKRAETILKKMDEIGFASENIVFGVGSYTYQHVTRDSFGFAIKATSGVVDGQRREIFKDPKTDHGSKKSAKGLLRVDYNENGQIKLFDSQTEEQEKQGLLKTIFEDGKIIKETNFAEIRDRLKLL